MTLFDFAYKNISRDFKTYIYHFLSCTFSVFVFFIFTNLAFHPALKVVDTNSSLGLVLNLGLAISIIFSFVFILYSIGNFLKHRSKQFAVLNIIGASNKQFNKIVFYENGIISILSLVLGMILGLIFSKFFLMIAESVIGDLDLFFYIPIKALIATILLMGSLFAIISLIAPMILRRKKIIELLKKEDTAEKSHLLFVAILLVIVLPITAYFHIRLDAYVYPLYLITAILLVYFALNLIFIIYELLMKVSKRKFKDNGLVKVSNFKYNIHTNLKTMTINMMLFTIVLSSLVVIVGAPKNVEEITKKIMPYSYTYVVWDKNINESEKVNLIREKLESKKGYRDLKLEYSFLSQDNRDIIISNSKYNEIAEFLGRENIDLDNDEYFLVGVDGKNSPEINKEIKEYFNKSGITKNEGSDKRVIALSGYFTSATVISDQNYASMTKNLPKENMYAFDIEEWKDAKEEEKELQNLVKLDGRTESLSSAYSYYRAEKLQRSIVAYVGSILCISFLLGIASITYSRLYSSSEIEIQKYKTMDKLGIDKDLIKQSLSSTVQWIFVLPFILALFTAWYFIYSLDKYILVSYFRILINCSIIYCLIECLLYILIKRKYHRLILTGIFKQD